MKNIQSHIDKFETFRQIQISLEEKYGIPPDGSLCKDFYWIQREKIQYDSIELTQTGVIYHISYIDYSDRDIDTKRLTYKFTYEELEKHATDYLISDIIDVYQKSIENTEKSILEMERDLNSLKSNLDYDKNKLNEYSRT